MQSSAGTAVTASENGTLSERSGTTTFKQAESGKTVAVALSQAKGVEGWNYTFSVSPASLSFEATGGTKSVSVTSYRRQTINGKETGGQENVGYTYSATNGFTAYQEAVIASENKVENQRNGTATYIQNGSGKNQVISLAQSAGSIEIRYEIEVSPNNVSWGRDDYGGGIAEEFYVESVERTYINGEAHYSSSMEWEYTTSKDTDRFTVTKINGEVLEIYPKNNNDYNRELILDVDFYMRDHTNIRTSITCDQSQY